MEFCKELEEGARDMSTANATLGWMFAGASAGAVATGGLMSAVNIDQRDTRLAVTALALIAGGALFAPAARALFTRSDAANILAEAANLGLLKQEDVDAYNHCTTAKGQWVRSRADANNFAVIMLNDQMQKEKEKKEEEEAARQREAKAIQDLAALNAKLEAEKKAKEEAEANARAATEKAEAATKAKDEAEKKLRGGKR